jgi:integrase
MINRRNYQLVRDHLAYVRDVYQVSEDSLYRYSSYLRHVLLWADEVFLGQSTGIRPTFSTYVTSLHGRRGEPGLAPVSQKKIIQIARRFFHWAKATYPKDFHELPVSWIETLRLPRLPEAPNEHVYVTLEEALALASLPAADGDLPRKRDRAAVAMLYLSGMRVGAFISLPVEAVDLSKNAVRQWPDLGVHTKNGKRATTYLLPIPELLKVVQEWDEFVRAALPLTARWYAPMENHWGESQLSTDKVGQHRQRSVSRRLKQLYQAAGLTYKSPHKFRHGHAVYGLQHAQTMADYKAVSLNLMHEDIKVTDEIYAPILSEEVKERIAGMTGETTRQPDDELLELFSQMPTPQLSRALVIIADRLSR